MKTYEKYLITEKSSLAKKLASVKKKIVDVSTPTEYRMAVKAVVAFLRQYRNDFENDISTELNKMLDKVQTKVGE